MIYENIKRICTDKGISISELEKKSGLGNGTIKKWETSSPTINKLEAVAKILDASIVDILGQERA